LVNRLVQGDPIEEALAFARSFTTYSLPVLALAREAILRSADVPLSDGLAIEAALATLAYRTHDAEEGMAAFVEKRKPEFRDA
jgi:enoyl-CoA hydratase